MGRWAVGYYSTGWQSWLGASAPPQQGDFITCCLAPNRHLVPTGAYAVSLADSARDHAGSDPRHGRHAAPHTGGGQEPSHGDDPNRWGRRLTGQDHGRVHHLDQPGAGHCPAGWIALACSSHQARLPNVAPPAGQRIGSAEAERIGLVSRGLQSSIDVSLKLSCCAACRPANWRS